MAVYQTNAIVLKRENIFEADRLYHLYTEEFGKVKAVAGSVRKINAKLSGHLEPFNLIWVELMTKKNGDLFITTALSYKNLLDANSSSAKLTLFIKMADFILKMMKEPMRDNAVWSLVLENFIKANLVDMDQAYRQAPTENFLNDFKSNLIGLLGFGNDIDEAKYYLGDFGV